MESTRLNTVLSLFLFKYLNNERVVPFCLGNFLLLCGSHPPFVTWALLTGGVIIGKYFIASFDVLEYLDHFKRKSLKEVAHSDPLTPKVDPKAKVLFSFLRAP